ncbi:hypothetical protein BD779DRAFT_1500326 [Infundibulicybe gibba]|nr:hypothetical protein BD779DRAFT_1500326 [Infundibulicybe gibba]
MSHYSESSPKASAKAFPPKVARRRAICSPDEPQRGRSLRRSGSESTFSPEKPSTKASRSATYVPDAISAEISDLTHYYESLLKQKQREYYESLTKYADTAAYMLNESNLRYELEDRNQELQDENAVLRVRLAELMEETSILKSNCRIEAWRHECDYELAGVHPEPTQPASQPPVQNGANGNRRRRRSKARRNQGNQKTQKAQTTPQRRPWA